MIEDKNKRQPPPEVEILNPRHKGVTPEMVGCIVDIQDRKQSFELTLVRGVKIDEHRQT